MNLKIYSKLINEIVFENKKYKLKLSFDRVLEMLDIQMSDEFTIDEKIDLSIALICPRADKISILSKSNLLIEITKKIFVDDNKNESSVNKLFDFEQDGEYIFASFMQAYGIDLYEQQDRLHFFKFIALFKGLPKETKIMEIIQIRSKQLPKPTKYNNEEIQNLMQLKEFYKLKISEEEKRKNVDRNLKKLAHSLIDIAEKETKNG